MPDPPPHQGAGPRRETLCTPRPNPRRSSPAWWLLRDDKTRSHPELGRQTSQRPWYCVSRPGRVGRRQARKDRHDIHPSRSTHQPHPPQGRGPGAGWSSPVARQAHNLKAAGSNPAPATRQPKPLMPKRQGLSSFGTGQNPRGKGGAPPSGGRGGDDPHLVDQRPHLLTQLRRIRVDRSTDRLLDLLRGGPDHRIDVLLEVERGGGARRPPRLAIWSPARPLRPRAA